MRRAVLGLLLCLLLLLVACSPALAPEEAEVRVTAGCDLPVGVWYDQEASPWEEGYLPDALRPVFFGETGDAGVRYRLFLGNDGERLAELLVAVCDTEARAVALAEHLALRLAEIAATGEEAYAPSLAGATVRRRGKTVVYTATPENGRVLALLF